MEQASLTERGKEGGIPSGLESPQGLKIEISIIKGVIRGPTQFPAQIRFSTKIFSRGRFFLPLEVGFVCFRQMLSAMWAEHQTEFNEFYLRPSVTNGGRSVKARDFSSSSVLHKISVINKGMYHVKKN